jgi:hypothetical protein
MWKLAPRPAVRALLALMLLLGSLGVWTLARPTGTGGQTERVGLLVPASVEQVVQADRQPLSPAAVDRRGDPGQARSLLLAILVGAVLLAIVWRWWGGGGRSIHRPPRGATPASAARAPPWLPRA